MKAIRLKVYQQEAVYKVPVMSNNIESYMLPTFSSVIGMIHNACNYKTYHDMKVSIQGSVDSTNVDTSTIYEIGNIKYNEDRHSFSADDRGITRGVKSIYVNRGINLIIHIVPNTKDFDTVYSSLKFPAKYLSLGRNEDALVIKSVEVVDSEYKELEDDLIADNGWYAWIPDKIAINTVNEADGSNLKSGTWYLIPTVYKIIELKKGKKIRKFNHKKVLLDEYKFAEDSNILIDEDNIPVFIE